MKTMNEELRKAKQLYEKHLDLLMDRMDDFDGGKMPTSKALASACTEAEKQILYADNAVQKRFWMDVRKHLDAL